MALHFLKPLSNKLCFLIIFFFVVIVAPIIGYWQSTHEVTGNSLLSKYTAAKKIAVCFKYKESENGRTSQWVAFIAVDADSGFQGISLNNVTVNACQIKNKIQLLAYAPMSGEVIFEGRKMNVADGRVFLVGYFDVYQVKTSDPSVPTKKFQELILAADYKKFIEELLLQADMESIPPDMRDALDSL